jgi:hypothetical protein
MYVIQHCFICRPLDSTASEDTGIEPSARIYRPSFGHENARFRENMPKTLVFNSIRTQRRRFQLVLDEIDLGSFQIRGLRRGRDQQVFTKLPPPPPPTATSRSSQLLLFTSPDQCRLCKNIFNVLGGCRELQKQFTGNS